MCRQRRRLARADEPGWPDAAAQLDQVTSRPSDRNLPVTEGRPFCEFMNGDPASRALRVGDLLLLTAGVVATRSLSATALGLVAFRLAAVMGALANEWAHIASPSCAGRARAPFTAATCSDIARSAPTLRALLPFGPDPPRRPPRRDRGPAARDSRAACACLGFWLSASRRGGRGGGRRLRTGPRWAFAACAFALGGCGQRGGELRDRLAAPRPIARTRAAWVAAT